MPACVPTYLISAQQHLVMCCCTCSLVQAVSTNLCDLWLPSKHSSGKFLCVHVCLQFLIIMFLLGINVATGTGDQKANNNPLIIANTCGLVINLAWVALAYWAVLQEHCRAAGALMALLIPCLGMPLINIVLCAPLGSCLRAATGFQRDFRQA